MLHIGDKIYYLDYEESHSSYTIKKIYEVNDNPIMKDGIYYYVHSDLLPNETGYYPIFANEVDNIGCRFFSSEEKASSEYKKWKDNVEKFK